MVAPAMDLDMWAHPSTQRNIATLRRDGVIIVEPQSGFLASGLTGKGRMEEPEQIVEAAENYFSSSRDMEGRRVLVTAGPTYENIDPVRFIGNYSSGKMGFAIAAEFAARGAEVTVVAGPVDGSLQLPAQSGYRSHARPTQEGADARRLRSGDRQLRAERTAEDGGQKARYDRAQQGRPARRRIHVRH